MTMTFLYIYLFKCILITVPCLSEATGRRWVRGPFHRCLQLYYYYSSLSKLNRILEGLNMLEKSGNFAHASELVKIYV